MWYSALPYKAIFAANLEETLATFRAQGIPEETIAYLMQQQGADKGMAINYLKGNPTATLQDIQGYVYDYNLQNRVQREQINRENAPTQTELNIIALFPEHLRAWPQVQLRKLRLQKTPSGYTYRGFVGGNDEDQGWNIQNAFQEIADWARYASREDPNFQLAAFNFYQALERSSDWHAAMAGLGSNKTYTPYKRNELGDLEDERIVYTFPDGWHISQVTNANDLSVEGNRMNHCVGGYCAEVESGDRRIFSLRDPRNEPKATIEMGGSDNIVYQIKGNSNARPNKELRARIAEWFGTLDYPRFAGEKNTDWEVHWDEHPETIRGAIYEEAYGRENYGDEDYDSGDRHKDYGIENAENDETRDVKELDVPSLLDTVENYMNGTGSRQGGWDRLDNQWYKETDITEALGSVIIDHDVQLLQDILDNPKNYSHQHFYQPLYNEKTKTFNYNWVLNQLGVIDVANKYFEAIESALEEYPHLIDNFDKPDARALADEDNNFRLYYLTLQEIVPEIPKIAALYEQITGIPEKHLYQTIDQSSAGGYQGIWSKQLMEKTQPKLMKHRDDFTNWDYPTLPSGERDESVFDEHGWKYSKRRVNWYK